MEQKDASVITDKQIIDELRQLGKDCLKYAKEDFPQETNTEQGLWARSYMIYLEKQLFSFGHPYYRKQELNHKAIGGKPIIRYGTTGQI
jgi:hypothetical protein